VYVLSSFVHFVFSGLPPYWIISAPFSTVLYGGLSLFCLVLWRQPWRSTLEFAMQPARQARMSDIVLASQLGDIDEN
jgi:hypothetical protein